MVLGEVGSFNPSPPLRCRMRSQALSSPTSSMQVEMPSLSSRLVDSPTFSLCHWTVLGSSTTGIEGYFDPTKRLAEKGNQSSGSGAFPERAEHQDSHGMRPPGQPIRFALTGGQAADGPQAIFLLDGIETGSVIADKGYESNRILGYIRAKGADAVIPPKVNRREPLECDRELYRQLNLIERVFNKLRSWRRMANRYDRRSLYFLSALYLVSLVIWG